MGLDIRTESGVVDLTHREATVNVDGAEVSAFTDERDLFLAGERGGETMIWFSRPLPPSSPSVAVEGTAVELRWSNRSAKQTGYRIERAPGRLTSAAPEPTGEYRVIASLPADAERYTETLPDTTGTYLYRVSAVRTVGEVTKVSPPVQFGAATAAIPVPVLTPPPFALEEQTSATSAPAVVEGGHPPFAFYKVAGTGESWIFVLEGDGRIRASPPAGSGRSAPYTLRMGVRETTGPQRSVEVSASVTVFPPGGREPPPQLRCPALQVEEGSAKSLAGLPTVTFGEPPFRFFRTFGPSEFTVEIRQSDGRVQALNIPADAGRSTPYQYGMAILDRFGRSARCTGLITVLDVYDPVRISAPVIQVRAGEAETVRVVASGGSGIIAVAKDGLVPGWVTVDPVAPNAADITARPPAQTRPVAYLYGVTAEDAIEHPGDTASAQGRVRVLAPALVATAPDLTVEQFKTGTGRASVRGGAPAYTFTTLTIGSIALSIPAGQDSVTSGFITLHDDGVISASPGSGAQSTDYTVSGRDRHGTPFSATGRVTVEPATPPTPPLDCEAVGDRDVWYGGEDFRAVLTATGGPSDTYRYRGGAQIGDGFWQVLGNILSGRAPNVIEETSFRLVARVRSDAEEHECVYVLTVRPGVTCSLSNITVPVVAGETSTTQIIGSGGDGEYRYEATGTYIDSVDSSTGIITFRAPDDAILAGYAFDAFAIDRGGRRSPSCPGVLRVQPQPLLVDAPDLCARQGDVDAGVATSDALEEETVRWELAGAPDFMEVGPEDGVVTLTTRLDTMPASGSYTVRARDEGTGREGSAQGRWQVREILPLPTAPAISIASENITDARDHELRLTVGDGIWDEIDFTWSILPGPGAPDHGSLAGHGLFAIYTPPTGLRDPISVTVECVARVVGRGDCTSGKARRGSSASSSARATFTVRPQVTNRDAVAPDVTITPDILDIDENGSQAFAAVVSGGRFDTLEYRWSSNFGTIEVDGASDGDRIRFLAGSVDGDKLVILECRVIARGTGGKATTRTADTSYGIETFDILELTGRHARAPQLALTPDLVTIPEGTAQKYALALTGGRYDEIGIAWTARVGSIEPAADNLSAVYAPGTAAEDTEGWVRVVVTVRGRGTNADADTVSRRELRDDFTVQALPPPDAIAPTVTITPSRDRIDTGGTVRLELSLSDDLTGDLYDTLTIDSWVAPPFGTLTVDSDRRGASFTGTALPGSTRTAHFSVTVRVAGTGERARAGTSDTETGTASVAVVGEPQTPTGETSLDLTVSGPSSLTDDQSGTYDASATGTFDTVSYEWSASAGTITGTGSSVRFDPPDVSSTTEVVVSCTATATGPTGAVTASDSVTVTVNPSGVTITPDISVSLSGPVGVQETGTAKISAVVTGDYLGLSYVWSASSGEITGDGASATFDPPDVDQVTLVTITCVVTATGSPGTTDDVATDTHLIIVRPATVTPPDAEAPDVEIIGGTSISETSTAALGSSLGGGIYDTIAYAWSASSGSITGNAGAAVFAPPNVDEDTEVTITLTVTVTGTGTNAAPGSTDTETATHVITVTPEVLPDALAPILSITGPAALQLGATGGFTVNAIGGIYDTIAYQWTNDQGAPMSGANTSTVRLTMPAALTVAALNLTCTVTVTGTDNNARQGTTDSDSASTSVGVGLPDAELTGGQINVNSQVLETQIASVSASVQGIWDELSRDWSIVSGGGTITQDADGDYFYNPPMVDSDTQVTIRCVVTARGRGRVASNGSVDTLDLTRTITVLEEGDTTKPVADITSLSIVPIVSDTDSHRFAKRAGYFLTSATTPLEAVISGVYDIVNFFWTPTAPIAPRVTYSPPRAVGARTYSVEARARGNDNNARNNTQDTETASIVIAYVTDDETQPAASIGEFTLFPANPVVAPGESIDIQFTFVVTGVIEGAPATVSNPAGLPAGSIQQTRIESHPPEVSSLVELRYTAPSSLNTGEAERAVQVTLRPVAYGVGVIARYGTIALRLFNPTIIVRPASGTQQTRS